MHIKSKIIALNEREMMSIRGGDDTCIQKWSEEFGTYLLVECSNLDTVGQITAAEWGLIFTAAYAGARLGFSTAGPWGTIIGGTGALVTGIFIGYRN